MKLDSVSDAPRPLPQSSGPREPSTRGDLTADPAKAPGSDGETPEPPVSKILIVDDLAENLLALNALIRQHDRLVFQASSGEEALNLLLEHDFALAILDVQMPGMNGFELAELMRGTAHTRHIPIIFVTAAGKESNYAFRGYESGAVDFLYKPLDMPAVTSKVRVFVDLDRQRNETRRQVIELERSQETQRLLMRELEKSRGELQASVQARDKFMSLVAHELRTPLNTLFLETQVRQMQLDRGRAQLFDEAYLTQMLARDRRQIESMRRLIDDMMDTARIRSNQLSIRRSEIDLSALLQRVVDDLAQQARAADCSVTLHSEPGVTGHWDAFRVEQVVINLLTNALRYGRGRPVTVSLVRLPDAARISVRDLGRGIAEADLQRIFDPFERVCGRDGTGGLGLGLFITRQLVEAHRGSIEVNSVADAGSEFTVTLPLHPPAESPD